MPTYARDRIAFRKARSPMDSIFENDLFEVGVEIDAYCTRCKSDARHTVITRYEEEIRSVLCQTCNSTHAFRPPRGGNEEDIPEPIAVRRRQSLQKLPWKTAIKRVAVEDAVPYSPSERYVESDVVDHSGFGIGYVSEVLSDIKFEAIFEDGHRILVHNRVDMGIKSGAKVKKKKGATSSKRPANKRPAKKTSAKAEAKAAAAKTEVIEKQKGSKVKTPKAKTPAKAKTPKAKTPKAKAPKKPTKTKAPKAKTPKAKAPKKPTKTKAPKAKANKTKAPKKTTKVKAPGTKAKAKAKATPKAKAPKNPVKKASKKSAPKKKKR